MNIRVYIPVKYNSVKDDIAYSVESETGHMSTDKAIDETKKVIKAFYEENRNDNKSAK